MNLCKDCQHFRPHVTILGGEAVHAGQPTCAAAIELVYGAPQTCANERTRSGFCGVDGANFEKRPENAKHYEMTFWVQQDRSGSIKVEAPTP